MDLVTNKRGLEYKIKWTLLQTEGNYKIKLHGPCYKQKRTALGDVMDLVTNRIRLQHRI